MQLGQAMSFRIFGIYFRISGIYFALFLQGTLFCNLYITVTTNFSVDQKWLDFHK
jgi:hypothetical protein